MSFFFTFYDTSFQNLTTGGSTCAILYVTYVRGYPPHFAIHTIPYHTSKMPYFCKLTMLYHLSRLVAYEMSSEFF